MRIGISLPWHYLAGIYNRDKASETVFRDCSYAPLLLKKLKKQGCSSIELRHWRNDLTDINLSDSFKHISEAGLNYTIHGDIAEEHLNNDIFSAFPWLKASLEELKNTSQKIMVITIHPVKKVNGNLQKLKEISETIISDYCSDIEKFSLPVKIAYENQREKGFTDPALNFSSISESIKKINRKELGTCWDMGHSYANYLKNSFEELPDDVFLKNAVHTHIHDLSNETGATHWPITTGNTPVEKYVKILNQNNYEGVFNLELSSERFSNLNIEEHLLKSIDILKGYIK